MRKNTASQVVGAQMNSVTTGAAVTSGTTTVYVTGDGGVQGTGTVGSGAATHEGNGFWTYAPAQAETNFDHVAFTFVNATAVNATIQIYTSFPQTGDNFARLGAPAGASVSADVAAVKAVLPAALVSGRIDASVGAIAAAAITAASIASDAITDAKVAADVTIASVTGAVGSVTGNVGGNVTGSVGSVVGAVGSIATGGIAAASFAAGAIDATAIATDAFGALEVAAGAASEIATAVRTELATELARVDVATSTRLASAGYTAPDNASIATIKATTDKVEYLIQLVPGSPTTYQLTSVALLNSPAALTLSQIVNGIWNEPTASHVTAGTTGAAVSAAGGMGDPWASVFDGQTAGDILRILAAVAAGKTAIVSLGGGAATVAFRDIADASDILSATMSGSERTAVTLAP